MPLAEWICIHHDPLLLLPRSELRCHCPSFPAIAHMSCYADSSGGAHAKSRVQGCQSSRNHSNGLDPVAELRGFLLVPCPDCCIAQVVDGRTQKEGENHGHLYFKCARKSVSSLLCLPNLSWGSNVLLILQYTKNCGFYHFHKEYLQMLKDDDVIVFRPLN
jgi:hypothetical protein